MRLTAAEAGALARTVMDLQTESDERPEEWLNMCRLKLMELVVMVRRAACHSIQAEVGNPLVARVLDIVDTHFAEAISNESLARAVGISTSRLMHSLFTEHMGQGIKHYILQLRVMKACELLLAEPGLKVESVARTVGFRYVADFNRAFKTYTRSTPAGYRAMEPRPQLHLPVRFGAKRC
jgi:transcriptional regulator GlxA family with amidase domain